jgi:hypothetical protein
MIVQQPSECYNTGDALHGRDILQMARFRFCVYLYRESRSRDGAVGITTGYELDEGSKFESL